MATGPTTIREVNARGWWRIAAGLVLIVVGAVVGRLRSTVRNQWARPGMLLVALSCGGVGLYLFVWGVGDVAVGRVGSYQLGGPEIQGMRFASPAEFEESIEAAAVVQPTLRRLALRCPDGRVLRTIYRLPWGTYGVPARDLVCADGFQLVTYAE